MKFWLIFIFAFLSFSFSPLRWTEKERAKFIKDCTKLGNSKRYCICFETYMEESVSPKEMIKLLKGNSEVKQEAHTECKFNNEIQGM